MRIEKLEYYDKATDWRLETTLFSDLTLLVGVSGVGKTRILEAIWSLKNISKGEPCNGAQWLIEFSTAEGDKYIWKGEYDTNLESGETIWDYQSESSKEPLLLFEELSKNGEMIIQRTESGIFLRGTKTPKLSSFQSVINILREEEEIGAAYNSFDCIISNDFSMLYSKVFLYFDLFPDFLELRKSDPRHGDIKKSNLPSSLKIALLYQNEPQIFQKVKNRFIEIFEQVEDVRVVYNIGKVGEPFEEFSFLQIKERGVEKWIPQNKISSGMYKTFMHICEMFLWPDGTVILIDEFENSLGVNCMSVLTEDLLQENRRLQFIITSHHPYIINNISPKYWKLVQRHGGCVSTKDASALRLGSSSQQAFIQLLNHEEYREGIMAA